jgi:hypothetical protein
MSKNCRFCGQPVKINEDYYDVFEGMHWLCFHLAFEHGNYDPDEPCDDPSCPWNRIGRGESYWTDHVQGKWDVKFGALNSRQVVEIKLIERENERLPSICVQIGLLGGVVGYRSKAVWYELSEVDNFINSLKALYETANGKAALSGMSPGAFDIEVENIDSKGHFVFKYEFRFHEYLQDFWFESSIKSGFEIDLQTIDRLVDGFEKMRSNKLTTK